LLQAYLQFKENLRWKEFFNQFDSINGGKNSLIKPLYKYNSKVNSESADIMANYVALSFQWHKCYGALSATGNIKKESTQETQKNMSVP
jgi:hypothetical protein